MGSQEIQLYSINNYRYSLGYFSCQGVPSQGLFGILLFGPGNVIYDIDVE